MVIGSSEKCCITPVMVKDKAGALKHGSTLTLCQQQMENLTWEE